MHIYIYVCGLRDLNKNAAAVHLNTTNVVAIKLMTYKKAKKESTD
jgi:hypothetical protein